MVPWLAPGVLDLRTRFRKIVDLAEYIDRPFLAELVGTAIWHMTQVDGSVTVWTTVTSHLTSWKVFCAFLRADKEDGWPNLASSRDLSPQHFIRFFAYLCQIYPGQSARAHHFYHLTGCLHALKSNNTDMLEPNFVVPGFPARLDTKPGSRRVPYSENERFEIVGLCRKEITAVVHRMKTGVRLIKSGRNPVGVSNGWRSKENVLWYVKNVLNGQPFMDACLNKRDHSSLKAAFSKKTKGYPTRDEIYGYIYPHMEDLTPFILILHALLDENIQCIMDLKLNDIELTENEKLCKIRFLKTRPEAKEFTKIYSNSSIWTPGRVISMVKKITEPLRRWTADPEVKGALWIYLARRGEPVRRVADGEERRMVAAFRRKHGCPDITLSRFRITNLSLAYRRTGNLALVKDRARHSQMQTTVHYLTNPGTSDLYCNSILDAQNEALLAVKGATIVPTAMRSEEQVLTDTFQMEGELANRIVKGEQDVFIASCKDFYNRPGGPPNTPCDRPFACFSCRNAVWLSRILPRLIRFRDFMSEQRTSLPADEWSIRFGFPYRVITEAILPAFSEEVVSLAEAAAPAEPFYIPITMR